MNNKELNTKLNQRIEDLEQQLAEVKAELAKEPVIEPAKVIRQYRPAEGYEHWFISDYGEIHRSTKQGELERHILLGNSYETEKEARLGIVFKMLCAPTEPMPMQADRWAVIRSYGARFELMKNQLMGNTAPLYHKLGILGTDKDRLQRLCDFLNEHPEFSV